MCCPIVDQRLWHCCNMLAWSIFHCTWYLKQQDVSKIVLKLHWFWGRWLLVMDEHEYKPCISKCLLKSRKSFSFLGRWVLLDMHKHLWDLTLNGWFFLSTDCFYKFLGLWNVKSWEITSTSPFCQCWLLLSDPCSSSRLSSKSFRSYTYIIVYFFVVCSRRVLKNGI